MNTMTQVTISLNDELNQMIAEALATRAEFGKNEQMIVAQALRLGLKQLNYRTKRNAEQYAAFKEFRASQKGQGE